MAGGGQRRRAGGWVRPAAVVWVAAVTAWGVPSVRAHEGHNEDAPPATDSAPESAPAAAPTAPAPTAPPAAAPVEPAPTPPGSAVPAPEAPAPPPDGPTDAVPPADEAAPPVVPAQAAPSDETDGDDVVVSSSREPRRRRDAPVRTEIVGADRMRGKGAANVIEALNYEPGIRIDNTCASCNTTGIMLAGLPSRYTLLVIDGMPVFSSLGTIYGLLNITTGDLRRIEIVRGANSVLYGTDAIAGVVNVITRPPSNAAGVEALAEGGQFGHLRLTASAQAGRGPLSARVSGGFQNAAAVDHNRDGLTEQAAIERAHAALTARLALSPVTATVRAAYVQENRRGGAGTLTVASIADQDGRARLTEAILTHRLDTSLALVYTPRDRVALHFDAAGALHRQDSSYGGTVYVADQLLVWLNPRVHARLHETYRLVAGASYRYEGIRENVAATDYRYHIPGVFAEGEWTPARAFSVLHGLRYDHHNRFGSVLTPRLVTVVRPHERVTLRAGAGRAFRAPTTFYEYAHGVRPLGYRIAQTATRPETAWNANVGLELDFDRWADVSVEGSWARVYDAIAVRPEDRDGDGEDETVVVANVSRPLDVVAVETRVDSRPVKQLALSLGWGAYWYRDKARAYMSARPTHQLTASAEVDIDEIGLRMAVNAIAFAPMNLRAVYGAGWGLKPGLGPAGWLDPANADFSRPVPARSPWYVLLSARIEQRLYKGLSAYVGVDNLLDTVQVDRNPALYFPRGADGNPGSAETNFVWGPLVGRRFYGGLRLAL